MPGYLLDTNHLGQAVTQTSRVRKRLEAARKAGQRLGTCVPALCEIEVGLRQVRYPDEYRLNLKRLLRHVRVWPLDLETAQHYGDLYRQGNRVILESGPRSWSREFLDLAGSAPDFPYPEEPAAADSGPDFDE